MDYNKILEEIYQEILPFSQKGHQADYIPALAKVDPDQFGMCLKTVSGEEYSLAPARSPLMIASPHF